MGEGEQKISQRARRWRKRLVRLAISAGVLLVFLPHVAGQIEWGILSQVENFLYDARVRLTMPGTIDPRVVVVDIDERSLAVEGQWPWPRDKVARLVDQLFNKYGVRALGFDVVFAEPDKTSALIQSLGKDLLSRLSDPAARSHLEAELAKKQPDNVFGDALAKRNIVLGLFFKEGLQSGERAETGALPDAVTVGGDINGRLLAQPVGYTGNLVAFQKAAVSGGFFDNPAIDRRDGGMRRVPLLQNYNGQYYESLALALTRMALNTPQKQLDVVRRGSGLYLRVGKQWVRMNEDTTVLVPYRGPQGSFPYVSATDVLAGAAPIDRLFDSIVLVGTTAPGLLDLRSTPVGSAYAGVEVHANMVSGLLDNTFRHEFVYARLFEVLLLIAIGAVFAWLLPAISAFAGILLVAGFIVGWIGVSILIWISTGVVVPVASPLFYSVLVILMQMAYSFLIESRNKRRLSRLFGQYVPPEIVDEMDQSEDEASLRSDSREMTVLFSDVRGFTTISEKLEPEELTSLMNAFLTPITRVIHHNRGTVDKYMGDAVMAFWGAPLVDAEHARHGLETALEMVKAMRDLWPEFSQRGWPKIEVGIGLNTGVMNVGNMGSEFRRAYTVLGDAVNLGSRLEGLTRQYNVDIVVSETTAQAVPEFAFRELGRVRVKGKTRPVSIYEPLGLATELGTERRNELDRHQQAMGLVRLQNWDAAEQAFRKLVNDHPDTPLYGLYLERIAYYREHPPGEDWDGVFDFKSK